MQNQGHIDKNHTLISFYKKHLKAGRPVLRIKKSADKREKIEMARIQNVQRKKTPPKQSSPAANASNPVILNF